MKLTPHYQQQVKQTTSHFFILPAKVFIHPTVKVFLRHCNARECHASCLHVSTLADRYHDSSVSSAVFHKKKNKPTRANRNAKARGRATTFRADAKSESSQVKEWLTSFLSGSTARASISRNRSKSARLAIQCGYHAAAIVPDL